MNKRFHYSPEKGSVMPCSAEQGGCKFGDQPHFNNLDEVKSFYAEMYKDQTFATHSRGTSSLDGSGNTPTSPQGGVDGDRERLRAMREAAARLMERRNDQSLPPQERIAMNKELRGIQAHADNLEKKIQRQGQEPTVEVDAAPVPQVAQEPLPEPAAAPAPLRRSKPREPGAPMGMRELNEEAKVTSNEEVLLDAAERGSARVLTSLSRNKNATGDSLARAAQRAEEMGDRDLGRKLQQHGNFPVENLTVKEYVESLTESNYKERGNSPLVTDAHLDAVREHGHNSVRPEVMREMILNRENKLTEGKIIEHLEHHSGPLLLRDAMTSGRFSMEKNVGKFSDSTLFIVAKDKNTAPRDIAAVTRELAKRSLGESSPRGRAFLNEGLLHAAANPQADESTKSFAVKMYHPGEDPSYYATRLHSDPTLPREAKLQLEDKVPSLRVKGSFERRGEAQGMNPRELQDAIIASRKNTSLGRSYTGTTIQLNMEKVREMGITEDELRYALGASNHNAGSSLDMETGVYHGRTDSSD